MNPTDLLSPTNALGYPAPYWFIVMFKVIGFFLHIIPMTLWYAGILVAMIMYAYGKENGRIFSKRIMNQMPIIIAAGVNFGIVPLLFTQVAYYRVFYSATILMAWYWFSIFILLIFAYYGVYIYGSAYKDGMNKLAKWHVLVGWLSAFIFIIIGFIFANGFSLMVNLESWHKIWQYTQVGAAVIGTGNNFRDPTLIPRWLMMFGIAIMTTAVYALFDANYFAKKESDNYKLWVPKFSLKLYILGMMVYAAFGSWYIFYSLDNEFRHLMLSNPIALITWFTALSPLLPFLCILKQYNGIRAFFTFYAVLFHLVFLALNAISRQLLQNIELYKYFDVSQEKINLQLSPLIIFVALFAITLIAAIYLISKKDRSE